MSVYGLSLGIPMAVTSNMPLPKTPTTYASSWNLKALKKASTCNTKTAIYHERRWIQGNRAFITVKDADEECDVRPAQYSWETYDSETASMLAPLYISVYPITNIYIMSTWGTPVTYLALFSRWPEKRFWCSFEGVAGLKLLAEAWGRTSGVMEMELSAVWLV